MKKIIYLMFLTVAFFRAYPQGTWTQSNLSTECLRAGTAVAASKIYIAGGARGKELLPSKVVDIYDLTTKQWSTSALSVAREMPSGVAAGNKVYFAGGIDFTNLTTFSTVDIFDAAINQWSTAQLSKSRFALAAMSYGNQVFFAGGISPLANEIYSTVDFLNVETGAWSVANLSEARYAFCAAQVGSKAIMAGGVNFSGVSDKLDIYDFAKGKWETKKLPLARAFLSAATLGTKVFMGGGMTVDNQPTSRVDIYDVDSDSWTTASLSVARAGASCVTACGKVYFIGGGKVNLQTLNYESASDVIDIYDPQTREWTVERLKNPLFNFSAVANENQIFIIGGANMDNSYKTMEIYTCLPTNLDEPLPETNSFKLFPNPAKEKVSIEFDQTFDKVELTITNLSGKTMFKTKTSGLQKLDLSLSNYLSGIYFIQVKTGKYCSSAKFVVAK